ncbi:MAG: hypothetical protein HY811_00815 [Planctomycetes bacterium]|nr:hypothetical protein [Planctomycetota bacterium]
MKAKTKLGLSILGVLGLVSAALIGFTNHTAKYEIKPQAGDKIEYRCRPLAVGQGAEAKLSRVIVYQCGLPLSRACEVSNGVITLPVGDERILSINGYDALGNPVETEGSTWDINRVECLSCCSQCNKQLSIKGINPGTANITLRCGGITVPVKVVVQ